MTEARKVAFHIGLGSAGSSQQEAADKRAGNNSNAALTREAWSRHKNSTLNTQFD